jgi:hypothetical protein
VQEPLEHAVEVVVAVGKLLARDRACDPVAQEETRTCASSRLLSDVASRSAL